LLFLLVPKTHHTEDQEFGLSENTPPSPNNLWSTPTAFDHTNIKQPRKNHPSGGQKPPLQQQVTMWPTPSTRDHKGGYIGGRTRNGRISNDTLDVAVQHTSNQKKEQKQLSAKWVTWLMGYPQGYLDISTESQSISQELQQEKKTEPKN
jgi:hypothetical protein